MSEEWRKDAACRGKPTTVLFFPAGPEYEVVPDLCHVCPVRQECLDYAVVTKQAQGVWGGMTSKERRKWARHNRHLAIARRLRLESDDDREGQRGA